jgi:hypothetical protein
MSSNDRRDASLVKAQEAQERADKAKDPSVKKSWAKIAEGYRDLARRQGAPDQD